MKKTLLLLALSAAMAFTACTEKENDITPASDRQAGHSYAYLLHEGDYKDNNASLSLLDLTDGTITNGYFQTVNGRPLGNLAQDILQHGSKVYITVSGSGIIEVLDAATGKSVQQINLGDRYPRYLAAKDGYVYASCYYPRSIVRIDTATLTHDATCALSGLQPESIAIAGDNLYVCNSYAALPDQSYIYDSTLSIVSLASFTESGKITVGSNPNQVTLLDDGRLAVACFGNYADKASEITLVDLAANSVLHLEGIALAGFAAHGTTLYTYGSEYDAEWNSTPALYAIDLTANTKTPLFPSALASIVYPYGISINPADGDLFVLDAQTFTANGDLYHLSPDGTLLQKLETSLAPKKVCFLK